MSNPKANMKLGIVHPMLFPQTLSGIGPIYETIEYLAEDPFFDCIELTWIKDNTVRKKVASLFYMSQMSIVYHEGGIAYAMKLDPHSLDSEKRKHSVQQIKRCVDDAVSLGACILQMIAGPDPGPPRREEAKKYYIDSLCELCEYASRNRSDHKITLCLENLDRDIHKKFLIGPTAEAVQIIQAVKQDYSNIGLTLDLAHLPLLGESFEEAVNIAKDDLTHVHLGNCILRYPEHPYYGDTHPPLGIAEGEIGVRELADFLRVLAKNGFLEKDSDDPTIVSFEVRPREGESSEIMLAATKRIFLRAYSRVFVT